MNDPINDSLRLAQTTQQQAPLAAEALKRADQESKLELAARMQQALDPASKALHPQLAEIVRTQVSIGNPVDVVGRLWHYQTDMKLRMEPNRRVKLIKGVIAQYLEEIGMLDRLPSIANEAFEGCVNKTDSRNLIQYFYEHYPNWLKTQYAIENGVIHNEVDYWRWVNQGCPIRLWQRIKAWWILTRRMPPVWRSDPDKDPEYRPDLFSSKPRTVVLRQEQHS